ncbi:MAG: alpha/beta fold hydrolase [Deltaproteobacteria bacterium]|nr:alpha/beta fold hydrolase [Deltaproteobacteria bacterium]
MTTSPTPHTLKIPGATLYYETWGPDDRPPLLMIPGGPADAGVFSALAAALSDRYRCVPYDPRGNSRSTFDGAPVEQDLDVHGDDVARLVEALGGGPAYVFGSSGGAQIGLNAAARHPERVKALVAHEPPCMPLLPDAADFAATCREIVATFHAEGLRPAMQRFMAMVGASPPPRPAGEVPPEEAAAQRRIGGNVPYFVAHGVVPIASYRPDVATLRAGAPRVVVGVGEASTGQAAHRAAVALARELGVAPVTFPGEHTGHGSHPAEFAVVLDRALRG